MEQGRCLATVALTAALAACSEDAAAPSAPRDAGVEAGPPTAAAARDAVDAAQVEADLRFVAAERPPGSPHWQAVQDLCRTRFEEHGFQVELFDYGSGVNVIGRRAGTRLPDRAVLLSAHYDHIPGCAGADDNATGVAGVLEAARVLGGVAFDRTLLLACWDEEELGLIGAEAYAARAADRGEAIDVMFSLEMLGYRSSAPDTQRVPAGIDLLFPTEYAALQQNQFRADFVALIPDSSAIAVASDFVRHATELALPTLVLEITAELKSNPLASDVRRSDHAAFWDHDIPALMVSDTSEFRYDAYHCRSGPDVVENLDLEFLRLNVRASLGAAVDALQR